MYFYINCVCILVNVNLITEKESKYPADEVVKQDIESVSVKNAMHVQEQEFFDNLKGERCCECSLDENKISEQNNTIKETLSSEKSTSKAIESKRRSVLFYPNFILASMIHNILVIMTLGLMSPPLATAITLVLVSTSLTWEIVVGRYLSAHVMAAYKESTEHLKAGRARLRSTFTSEGTESANSVNSINSHRLRSDSSSEGDLLDNGKLFRIDELEHQCINIWCAPRKCMWLISYCSGVFYAFLLLDMLAGAEGLGDALWILAVCMALPALIVRTVQIFVKAQPPPISLIHESSEKMNNSLPAKESSIMAENEGIDSTMYRDTRNSFVEMPNVKSINIYLLNSTIRFPSINIFMYLMEITQHAQSSFFLTCLSSSLAH